MSFVSEQQWRAIQAEPDPNIVYGWAAYWDLDQNTKAIRSAEKQPSSRVFESLEDCRAHYKRGKHQPADALFFEIDIQRAREYDRTFHRNYETNKLSMMAVGHDISTTTRISLPAACYKLLDTDEPSKASH